METLLRSHHIWCKNGFYPKSKMGEGFTQDPWPINIKLCRLCIEGQCDHRSHLSCFKLCGCHCCCHPKCLFTGAILWEIFHNMQTWVFTWTRGKDSPYLPAFVWGKDGRSWLKDSSKELHEFPWIYIKSTWSWIMDARGRQIWRDSILVVCPTLRGRLFVCFQERGESSQKWDRQIFYSQGNLHRSA